MCVHVMDVGVVLQASDILRPLFVYRSSIPSKVPTFGPFQSLAPRDCVTNLGQEHNPLRVLNGVLIFALFLCVNQAEAEFP